MRNQRGVVYSSAEGYVDKVVVHHPDADPADDAMARSGMRTVVGYWDCDAAYVEESMGVGLHF